MKIYAVINIWHDSLGGGYEASIVSPMYTSREEAEKHMFSRCNENDTVREYELKDNFNKEMK